jgi:hypothetical protein
MIDTELNLYKSLFKFSIQYFHQKATHNFLQVALVNQNYFRQISEFNRLHPSPPLIPLPKLLHKISKLNLPNNLSSISKKVISNNARSYRLPHLRDQTGQF